MKINVTVQLEVDSAMWRIVYGTALADVRDEVREYVRDQILGSAAADASAITDARIKP